jgi:hypothetical protein
MRQSSVRRLTGWLAVLSLGICLAAPVLFFLGQITEARYKRAFLLASVAWFILATGRGMAAKKSLSG